MTGDRTPPPLCEHTGLLMLIMEWGRARYLCGVAATAHGERVEHACRAHDLFAEIIERISPESYRTMGVGDGKPDHH